MPRPRRSRGLAEASTDVYLPNTCKKSCERAGERAQAYDMLRHTMGPPGKRQSPDCRVSHRPLVLIALTQDPEQLIEATVQFIGARPGVNTSFKVTADLSPFHWGRGQKVSWGGHVQIDAACVM